MHCKFNLLSIDGGGIRGIIPAILLAEIEKRTNKRISELFDLIAGTSTGGLVALALTKPNPVQPNVALYTAQDLVELYRNHGRRIFDERESVLDEALERAYSQFRSILQNLPLPINLPEIDINSLRGPKFPSIGREAVLTEFLGETLIKEALKEVFITSYDTELRTPIFFTSNQLTQTEKNGRNFRKICDSYTMKQAAMATSAAPTYFAPYKVDTTATDSGYYSLIDGGVYANNPTSLATLEAIVSYRKATKETLNLDDILVVSLGTGSLTRQYLYQDIKNWGSLDWGRSLLGIVFDGQSESVACQLEQLLPDGDELQRYYRFQGLLTDANDDIDIATPENIADLERVAGLIVQQRDGDLDRLCEQLVESKSKIKS